MTIMTKRAVRGHDAEDFGDDEHHGWAALWSQCQDAAAGIAGAPAAANAPRLTWSPAAGWTLRGSDDDETMSLFALYKPLLDCRPPGGAVRPYAIGQLGQSLDGFIATPTGDSRHLNGPQNLRHLHRLRALCDAVIVGAGTVAADNPRLTTRLVPGRHPVRVVLDPRAALPPDRVLFVDGIAPTLWLHDAGLPPSDPPPTCEPVAVPGLVAADGGVDLRATLAALRDRGLAVVFVEGGGVTVSRALAQGVLDRLHVAVAPLLIGRGRPGLQGPARASLAECRRPPARAHAMGADVLWDLDLRPAA